jgi:hypothetical protein
MWTCRIARMTFLHLVEPGRTHQHRSDRAWTLPETMWQIEAERDAVRISELDLRVAPARPKFAGWKSSAASAR